jgi:hypothetical protein
VTAMVVVLDLLELVGFVVAYHQQACCLVLLAVVLGLQDYLVRLQEVVHFEQLSLVQLAKQKWSMAE